MGTVANIYDNGPISPIARIYDNLSIWSENRWKHHVINFIEPIPRSSPMVVEMVVASGATTIAANGTIAKRIVTILLMTSGELLHLRWEPLDDVEGLLWELSGAARFNTRGAHARVTPFTHIRDPYLASTTFWLLGGANLDMNLEVRNPLAVAQPVARFVFFGYRYILEPLSSEPSVTTYLPAQGK